MDWGFSHGNLDDVPHTSSNKLQEQLISTAAAILPASSYLRFGIKVDSAGMGLAFDQARSGHDYDQLMYQVAHYGLKPVVNLHVGSSPYVKPQAATGGLAGFYAWIQSIADRYAPGGTFGNGSTASVYGVNQTVSGWSGVTRFEIWNEPNSPTGNAGDTTGSTGGMKAADAYAILYWASKALRDHGQAHGWTPYLIAFGLATTEGGMQGYWKTIVDYGATPAASAACPPYTVGATTYGPNPHDFCDAVGIHPYSSADPALSTGSGSPIQATIGPLRTYCDANGGSAKDFYITEWGWRGHNLANRYNGGASNVEWEGIADAGVGQGSQELWEIGGMSEIQALIAWKIRGAHHYQIPDDNSGGATQCLGVTYNALAGTATGPIPGGSWKPVATAMQTAMAASPPAPAAPTANILTRGHGIHLTV